MEWKGHKKMTPTGNKLVVFVGSYGSSEYFNFDETSFNFLATSNYQYIRGYDRRAEGTDDKTRFTAGIGVFADGTFMPSVAILRCTKQGDDQSATRVIGGLLHVAPFKDDNCWKLRKWERSIQLIKV